MRDESEYEQHREHAQLHGALGAAVGTLLIGASPTADVMRDGAARRTRRRMALASGVATLAVLPVAAVGVFAGGGAKGGGSVSAASSSTSTARTEPNPPPIVVPTPLPAPGQLNHDLPNDSVVVLAGGTQDGKHWRLVRDRYVVAGPESDNVMDDVSSRAHLPYAANWDKPGTVECDFTGIEWGDGAPGGRSGGGACNPTSDGSITAVHERFAGGSRVFGLTDGTPPYIAGRIDATDVAYLTVDIDGRSFGKQPVIQVPGEKNGYYAVMLKNAPTRYKALTITLYDAQGQVLGRQQ